MGQRQLPTTLRTYRKTQKSHNKIIDQKHIIKLDMCSDRQLISPIFITVKKDQTVKLALDSQKINKFIHKNRYQMPYIDLLLDNIAQVVKSDKTKQMLFSKRDLLYAYAGSTNARTMQLQFNRWLCDGNVSISNRF